MKTNQSVSLTSSPVGITKHIPNFLTLCNLACGALGIIFIFEDHLLWAAAMVFVGAVFDFFDGFSARLLKVSNELGKQLDSMADMATFGVLPGILAYKLLMITTSLGDATTGFYQYLPYIAVLIPVFSGLRLAKFNIDTRQSDSFIGLPTPANALFWSAATFIILPLYMQCLELAPMTTFKSISLNPLLIASCVLLLSLLLVAELPLIALKFKNFGFADNKVRYIFIGLAILTIIGGLLIKNVFVSIPIILLLYLIISIVNNLISKGNEVQSGN